MTLDRTKRRVLAIVGAVGGLVLLSHVVVECAGWRLLQPAADESLRVVEAFRQRGERVDVALLGSSRMRRAVTVTVLEEELARLGRPVSAFNFGLQAGTVPAFYILARDVLRDELAPRLLVVGLGVRSLNGNNPRYARTIRHMVSPLDLFGPLGPRMTSGAELGAGLLAAFRAPGTLLQFWRVGEEPGGEIAALLARRGSIYEAAPSNTLVDLRELEERTEKRARRTREKLLADFDVGRSGWALERLLALAQERGVAVVVANLPVTEPFATAAYRDDQYERTLEGVTSLCATAGVRFVDFNTPDRRPPLSAFIDGDHLNAVGATAFSRSLAVELAPSLTD